MSRNCATPSPHPLPLLPCAARIVSEHTRTVNRVQFHSLEPTMLLSGSQDGTMKMWVRGRLPEQCGVAHSPCEAEAGGGSTARVVYGQLRKGEGGPIATEKLRERDLLGACRIYARGGRAYRRLTGGRRVYGTCNLVPMLHTTLRPYLRTVQFR